MTASRRFANEDTSVHDARGFVGRCLHDVGPEDVDSILLMVSELATNSVRYGEASYDVDVFRSERNVRVVVTDRGAGLPMLKDPPPHVATGRGLRIVDALADDWGVEECEDGRTSVWFCVRSKAHSGAQRRR